MSQRLKRTIDDNSAAYYCQFENCLFCWWYCHHSFGCRLLDRHLFYTFV